MSARQHVWRARYMPSPVHPSVRPSVTRVDQWKTVEVRIMQFSPYSRTEFLIILNLSETFYVWQDSRITRFKGTFVARTSSWPCAIANWSTFWMTAAVRMLETPSLPPLASSRSLFIFVHSRPVKSLPSHLVCSMLSLYDTRYLRSADVANVGRSDRPIDSAR